MEKGEKAASMIAAVAQLVNLLGEGSQNQPKISSRIKKHRASFGNKAEEGKRPFCNGLKKRAQNGNNGGVREREQVHLQQDRPSERKKK